MGKSRNKIRYVFFLLCLLWICSGCGGKKDEETENTAEQPKYYDFEAVTEIEEGRPDIYVILKVYTSQYWQDIVSGVRDAGTEHHCNIYAGAAVAESDWEAQQVLLDQAEASGADAIILAPGNSSALSEPVKQLHQKEIPIILVDTILNDTESFDTCFMTDNLHAGELAAEEMLRLLEANGVSSEEEASIAIQITSASSQTVIDRLAGFNQYWAVHAPKNWTVLDEIKENNGDSALAQQNSVDFLEEYPEIKGVFGCNNSSTVGFVNGLKESGRNDVILVGFDYADETAELIASEDWQASVVVQNQYDMGYEGILEALLLLDGNDADYKFVDTETRVITHENYEEYERSVTGE